MREKQGINLEVRTDVSYMLETDLGDRRLFLDFERVFFAGLE